MDIIDKLRIQHRDDIRKVWMPLANEYRAEIARLQAEVERHQALITKMLNARRNDVKHIRNTAHNDAIEAAAQIAGKPFLPLDIGGDLICDPSQSEATVDAIRALRRPT